MLKKIGTVFLLTALGLILLYGLFPIYAPTIAAYGLAKQNIQLVALDVGYPSWRRLPIRRLVVREKNVGSITFLDGVLILDKTRGHVLQFSSIRQSELKNEFSIATNKNKITKTISQWLPSQLFAELPLFDIDVEVFENEIISISGFRLTHDKSRLRNSFLINRFQNNTKIQSRVEITLDRKNVFDVIVEDVQTHEKQLKSKGWLSLNNNIINAQIDIRADFETLVNHFAIAPTTLSNADFSARFNLLLLDQVFDIKNLQDLMLNGIINLDLENDKDIIQARFYSGLEIEKNAVKIRLFDEHGKSQASKNYSKILKRNAILKKEEGLSLVFKKPLEIQIGPLSELGKKFKNLKIKDSLTTEIYLDKNRIAEVHLSDLTLDIVDRQLSFLVDASLQGSTLENLYPDLEVKINNPKIGVSAKVFSNSETSKIEIRKSLAAQFNNSTMDEYGFSNIELEVPAQMLVVEHQGLRIEELHVNFAARHLEYNSDISADFFVTLDGSHLHLNAYTNPTVFNKVRMPVFKSEISIDLSDSKAIMAEFALRNTCEELIASGVWQSIEDLNKISVKSEKTFTSTASLQQWLNIAGLPFDIGSGDIAARLDITYSRQANDLHVMLELRDISGISEYASFDGVQFVFSSVPILLSNKNQAVFSFVGKIDRANVGVALEAIEFSGRFVQEKDAWRLNLDNAEASAFGGLLRLENQTGKLSEDMVLNMQLEDLDLAQIVATQQLEGLVTTGRLSGELPVAVKKGGIYLGAGEVRSTGGGLIRYVTPLKESAELNEQLKLTLNVLENFNYEILDSLVSYIDGNLVLQSKIIGHNPDVAEGQQVDLNLNTQVELGSAIQVMRLQSGLEAQIEKFIEQKVDPTSEQNICQSGNQ